MAIMTGDSIEDSRFKNQRKYGCFALYVAYRLDPAGSISHQAKISQLRQSQLFTKGIPIESASGDVDGVSPIDMAYVLVYPNLIKMPTYSRVPNNSAPRLLILSFLFPTCTYLNPNIY